MALEIITKEDLEIFRIQLLDDLRQIVQPKQQSDREWIKSSEVRSLLKISPGTLQNLRINGTLSFTKIGGIIYYSSNGINQMLEGNKINHQGK